MRSVQFHPGSWSMIATRRSGTLPLAHAVDPTYGVRWGSIKTHCGKAARSIEHLGQLSDERPVCQRCLRAVGRL